MHRWPPILGLHKALTVTLTYLRRNRIQEEIAEKYGVSRPTISRAISVITPVTRTDANGIRRYGGQAGRRQAVHCERTLLPCWSWASWKDLYSGKNKKTA